MRHELSVKEQIDQIERRLEIRRDRMWRHFNETADSIKTSVAKAVKWWPLVAVAGGLAAGFAAAKYPRHAASKRAPVRYVSVRAETRPPSAAPRYVLPTILGIAATALRIGASKELHTLVNAVRASRARREHAR